MTRRWSKESIIFEIQRWVEKTGEIPTAKLFIRVDDLPHPATIRYHFKSVDKAIVAAGYTSRKRGCLNHTIAPPVRDIGKFVAYRKHHEYV